jgi:hypothetical protein
VRRDAGREDVSDTYVGGGDPRSKRTSNHMMCMYRSTFGKCNLLR